MPDPTRPDAAGGSESGPGPFRSGEARPPDPASPPLGAPGANAGGGRNPDAQRSDGGQNLATGATGSAAPRTAEPHPGAPSDRQSELDATIPRLEVPADDADPEIALLRSRLGEDFLGATTKAGERYAIVRRETIVEALLLLRDEAGFDYFSECLGVDYSLWTHERDTDGRFEVVYNLMNVAARRRLFVKIGVPDGESVPTAKGVFAGAEFPEKEIRDLLGVSFAGNSFLPGTRFLLPDDWIGHPLRKEAPLGGEDVLFDAGTRGPAVEDRMMPHAGESFEGRTGTEDVSGR